MNKIFGYIHSDINKCQGGRVKSATEESGERISEKYKSFSKRLTSVGDYDTADQSKKVGISRLLMLNGKGKKTWDKIQAGQII